MPWIPNMQDLKLLALCWRSFSECGRERVTAVFVPQGCKHLSNGCLQPIGRLITQDAKLKIIDAPLILILRIGRWPCCCLWCPQKLPIRQLYITATKTLLNYRTYRTTNLWRSLDSHYNVLSIQHLLPSSIIFIMIWTYWLCFWQIVSQPCGKAECSNILALFALKLLIFIYLATRFIAPAIHLFMNRYSQATAYHPPIIYL